MDYELDSEGASIVVVGSFNPSIFHPEWLLRHQLIPQDDIEDSKVEIVHGDLCKFTLSWLGFDVLRNKLVARTNDPARYGPLKDLIVSIFKILEHTPITQMGINLEVVYNIQNEEKWHKIGDTLVPKAIWEESLPGRVGLKTLTIESPRPDDLNGYMNVIISPAGREPYRVRLIINNHIELEPVDKEKADVTMSDAPTILSRYWDSMIASAKNISEKTISKAITS